MTALSNTADASHLIQILRHPDEEVIRAAEAELDTSTLEVVGARALNIGLIDCHKLSQECLIKAFEGLEPRPVIVPFETIPESNTEAGIGLDLIVYYSHSNDSAERTIVGDVTLIRQVFKTAPVIVLSDAEDAEHPNTIRSALKNGAQGFIPTRTTGIPITFAAIRFIVAGGVFAPLDLLLTKRSDRVIETAHQSRLTPRQLAVLNHLQQGKANKIIAHELGMSESTVKVHVRNIMRKTGATNRTEAAFKAQKLWGNGGMANMMSAGAY
ncbi:MAG TPA: response regulator transcription factor [Rhodopila sp.]